MKSSISYLGICYTQINNWNSRCYVHILALGYVMVWSTGSSRSQIRPAGEFTSFVLHSRNQIKYYHAGLFCTLNIGRRTGECSHVVWFVAVTWHNLE